MQGAIYKRATRQLQEIGITDIVIKKRLYGASPYNINATRQVSQCFPTWQKAVAAVIAGFRPTIAPE